MKRILLVEDNADLALGLRNNLEIEGYAVESAEDGATGLTLARRLMPDLLILDLMLPDVSGTEICRQVRGDPRLAGVPVLMLTAKSEEVDRIVGFELGADDYVTKPFSPRELVLRVRALLRRASGEGEGVEVLEQATVRLDVDRHRCQVDGYDLSEAVLYNGGGRATADATPEMKEAEAHARTERLGVWQKP